MICPVCPRRFKEEQSLKRHLILHTEVDYCCPKCDMIFSSYGSMVAHQDSHILPEETHHCVRCNKNFSSSLQEFQKHMKNHDKASVGNRKTSLAESKPFGCSICKQLRSSNNNKRV